MNKEIKALDRYSIGNMGKLEINHIYQGNRIVCISLGTSDFSNCLLCDIFSHPEIVYYFKYKLNR